MIETKWDKYSIENNLAIIIRDIAGININEPEKCLFAQEYGLTAELFVYILLRASREFGFEINDKFVETLNNYSFSDIVNSILKQFS